MVILAVEGLVDIAQLSASFETTDLAAMHEESTWDVVVPHEGDKRVKGEPIRV